MVRNRRRHTAAYNFRVAMKALEGSKTIYGEPRSLDRETGEIRCIQTDAFCLPPSGGLGAEAAWRRRIQMSIHEQGRQNATRTGAVDAPNRWIGGNT